MANTTTTSNAILRTGSTIHRGFNYHIKKETLFSREEFVAYIWSSYFPDFAYTVRAKTLSAAMRKAETFWKK
jgi:hypothetical protein